MSAMSSFVSLDSHRLPSSPRRGVTMIELLIASSIMALLVATLGVMANAVYSSNEYCQGNGLAAQHGRMVVERINRAVRGATANETNPGVMVLDETVAGYRFADTLIVWHPTGDPANRDSGPRTNELIVFAPNPSAPNELLEITDPTDSSAMPAYSNTTGWRTAIDAMKTSATAKRIILTDLLKTGRASTSSMTQVSRACVRFDLRVLPSLTDWTAYLAASNEANAWLALPWAQSVMGTRTGLWQSWVRFELQLMPGSIAVNSAAAMPAVPLYGSGALYYQMRRK